MFAIGLLMKSLPLVEHAGFKETVRQKTTEYLDRGGEIKGIFRGIEEEEGYFWRYG